MSEEDRLREPIFLVLRAEGLSEIDQGTLFLVRKYGEDRTTISSLGCTVMG